MVNTLPGVCSALRRLPGALSGKLLAVLAVLAVLALRGATLF
jgi:hypothetical protein